MWRTFCRYVTVQIVAYAIDMGGFIAVSAMGAAPVTSNVFAKLAAGAFAFAMHRGFTFGVHKHGHGQRQMFKYVLLLAANIPVSSAILVWLLRWIDSPVLAKFVADVICVVFTYVLSRHIVFRVPVGERPR